MFIHILKIRKRPEMVSCIQREQIQVHTMIGDGAAVPTFGTVVRGIIPVAVKIQRGIRKIVNYLARW